MQIREARREDVPEIHRMIGELAEFEKLSDQFVASEDDLEGSLFGENPPAEALVAELDGELCGYAVFFSTYSTFLCKAGIWLEDIYVRPPARGKGIGKALLKAVGGIAVERGSGRYEWAVLDWNQRAIDFYEAMEGKILDDWRIVRMEREQIEKLTANGAEPQMDSDGRE